MCTLNGLGIIVSYVPEEPQVDLLQSVFVQCTTMVYAFVTALYHEQGATSNKGIATTTYLPTYPTLT